MATAFSAGDKASCSVITSVSLSKTTDAVLGAWPVLCCSKALAAWASRRATVTSDLSIGFGPSLGRPAPGAKKADVAERPEAFDHVGLLVNGPPGTAGLPFS